MYKIYVIYNRKNQFGVGPAISVLYISSLTYCNIHWHGFYYFYVGISLI